MHSGSFTALLPPALALLGALFAPPGNRTSWQEELPWLLTTLEAPRGPLVMTPGAVFPPGAPPHLPRPWTRPEASLPAVFLVHADADRLAEATLAHGLDAAPLSAESFAVWVPSHEALLALESDPDLGWIGAYQPGYKLTPHAVEGALTAPFDGRVQVELLAGAGGRSAEDRIRAFATHVHDTWEHELAGRQIRLIEVSLAKPIDMFELARIEGVLGIHGGGRDGERAELEELFERARTQRVPFASERFTSRGSQLWLATLLHTEAATIVESERGSFLAPSTSKDEAFARELRPLRSSDSAAGAPDARGYVRHIQNVHARDGFPSRTTPPQAYTVRVVDPSLGLSVDLHWNDEPGASPTALTNDLDLLVVQPDGTPFLGGFGGVSETRPGGHYERWQAEESVRIDNPRVGTWTILVGPDAGPFSAGQGYSLAVGGGLAELETSDEPTRIVLRPFRTTADPAPVRAPASPDSESPRAAAHEPRAALLATDGDKVHVADRAFGFGFDGAVPSNVVLRSLTLEVDHEVTGTSGPGFVRWELGRGSLAAPTILDALEPELVDAEGTSTWDITDAVRDVASANRLVLTVRDSAGAGSTALDRAVVIVEFDTLVAPRIASKPTLEAVVGQPYVYDADRTAETSGSTPVRWSATTAPLGFEIDPITGSVNWTPKRSGTFEIELGAENRAGRTGQGFTIEVTDEAFAPEITSSAQTLALLGKRYFYQPRATGSGPLEWRLEQAPAGALIDPVTGAFSWTPTETGTFTFSLNASNTAGADSQSTQLNVSADTPPVITSIPNLSGKVGEAYSYDADDTTEATGTAPIVWSKLAGPTEFAIDSATGLVTFTPALQGFQSITIRAANNVGSDTQTFTVDVAPPDVPPTITTSPALTGKVGEPYIYNADAAGTTPVTFSLTTSPAGVSFDPGSGFLSWVPSAVGTFTFRIEATNVAGTGSQTWSVVIDPADSPPTITTVPVVTAKVGELYSYDADANGTQPISWTKVSGPGAIAVHPSTGLVTWTPAAPGVVQLTIRASNVAGAVTQNFQITVAPPDVPPSITSTPTLGGFVNEAYVYDADSTAEATGTAPISWSILSAPPEFSIDPSTGLIAWTPITSGTTPISIIATNVAGTEVQSFDVIVLPQRFPPTITSTPPTTGKVDVPFGYDPVVTGTTPITWSKQAGPAELSVDSATGAITWTPVAQGPQTVSLQATNAVGSDVQTFTVNVTPRDVPPTITTIPPLSGKVGVPFVYDADALGTTPLTWSKVIGPAEFSINPASGIVTWTPVATGNVTISLQATNVAGTGSQTFTVSVAPPDIPPTITSVPPTTGKVGTPFVYDVDADGSTPITFTKFAGPAEFTINPGSGIVTWTPTASGSINVTVQAQNAFGTDSQTFTVAVAPADVPPAIVSTPTLTGKVGEAYSYDADNTASAIGTLPIVWSVLSGPVEFSIDPSSGLVTWIPVTAGTISISIRATNVAGSEVQFFDVLVAPPNVPPTITSTPPPTGKVGVAYPYSPTASGTTPISWAKLSGPAQFSIHPTTGVVSWTPVSVGVQSITIEATNVAGSYSQTFSVDVAPPDVPPTITSTPDLFAQVDTAWLYTATASGTTPLTWTKLAGPPEFSIAPGTGVVSWTPVTDGPTTITLQVGNVAGIDQQTFTLDVLAVNEPPTIVSMPSLGGKVGEPYAYDGDATAEAVGSRPITWSKLVGPTEFMIDAATGIIAWTPTSPGTFTISIVAANSGGSEVQTFDVVVAPADVPPTITSSAPTTGKVGQAFVYDANADGTTPLTWTKVSGPAALSVDPATGLVSWIPVATGVEIITLEVANTAGSDTQTFFVDVSPPDVPPTISTVPPLAGKVGMAYSYDADATGTNPITWTKLVGPPEVLLDSATGIVTWTPTVSGPVVIRIQASNAAGVGTQTFTVNVAPADVPPTITSAPVLAGSVGVPYSYDANAVGTVPIAWSKLAGPAELVIDAVTGIVTWTPTLQGTYSVSISASNVAGSSTQTFQIVVTPPNQAPTITSTPNLATKVGDPYQYDADGFAQATGTQPITWSVSSAPAGFAIDPLTGFVSWTPLTLGSQTISIIASNVAGSNVQSFIVTVGPENVPPTITSMAPTTGKVGTPFVYTASASGTVPFAWSKLSGPAGFDIDSVTGTVTWTPNTAGSFSIAIQVSNPVGNDSEVFTVTVAPADEPPTIVSSPLLSGRVGDLYSYDANAIGSEPISWSVLSGPAEVMIDAGTGLVSWIPAVPGAFLIRIQAANGAGVGTQSFTVVVADAEIPPTIVSLPPMTGELGNAFGYQAIATGSLPLSWTKLAGPPELSIDPSTGLVNWVPAAIGPVSITIQVANAYGSDAQSFLVDVIDPIDPPVITTAPATLITKVFEFFIYEPAADGTAPISWAKLAGPDEVNVEPRTGRTVWYPTAPGLFTIELEASNAAGSDTQSFVVDVRPSIRVGSRGEQSGRDGQKGLDPPIITSTAPTTGQVGSLFVYDADAKGSAPLVWSVIDAPAGLSLDPSSGLVTWAPSVQGRHSITIQVANAAGVDQQAFSVDVAPGNSPPTITTVPSLSAKVGEPYTYDADAIGTAPITWSLLTGPPEVSVDSATGVLTWTPTVAGNVTLRILASNVAGTGSQTFTVAVAPSDAPPAISTTPPAVAKVGQPFVYDADATGAVPLTWSKLTGPAEFSIDATSGVVTWTPATDGLETITIGVTNAAGADSQTFTVDVAPADTPPSITSTPSLTARIGEAYQYDADATAEASGTQPITWSVFSGPAEFSIDANTGLVTWTPLATGTVSITILAANVAGSELQSFDVVVDDPLQPPTITSVPPSFAKVGVPFAYTATANGTSPIIWTKLAGPAAFSIDAASGIVSWTPVGQGLETITIAANNAAGGDVQVFTVTVGPADAPPSITTTPPPVGKVGEAYSYDADASGTQPIAWSILVGPPEASIDAASGLLSWTPIVDGNITIQIEAANVVGSTTQSFTVTVAPNDVAPSITSTPPLTGQVGEAFVYDADATGTAPLAWAKLAGPAELSIDAGTGLITWTPVAAGLVTITIEASNVAGSDSQTFTVDVAEADVAPSISSTPGLTATVGEAYVYDADASGTTPLAWTTTAAPLELSIDAGTGLVTWTPVTSGLVTVTIEVSNVAGSDSQTFTVDVAAPDVAPTITTTAPTTGKVGVPFVYDADADGSDPIVWTKLAGPAEFSIDSVSGVVSWTPAASGLTTITIQAGNGAGADTQIFSVNVAPPDVAPTITTTAPSTGGVGEAFAYDADASGTTPLTWAKLAGPAEFSIDAGTGVVSWLPATAGLQTITIEVSNAAGSDTETFTVDVVNNNVPPTITTLPPLSATVGMPYSYDADATGSAPISWAVLIGPPEVSINSVTGLVSWTPIAAGTFTVRILAFNTAGNSTQTFSVTVAPQDSAPLITSSPTLTGKVGVTWSYDADADGSTPLTWSKVSGPAEFSIASGTGIVTWVPTTAGATAITIQATNAFGSDTQTFTIDVAPPDEPPTITTSPTLTGKVGELYTYDANADGSLPLTWTILTGPPEAAIDSATGVLSWTPVVDGNITLRVLVVNSFGNSTQTFTVVVAPADALPAISSSPNLTGKVGVAYAYDAEAAGTAPMTWTKTAGPIDLTIEPTSGVVNWTPSVAGTFAITLDAANAAGSDTQTFSVDVAPPDGPPSIGSTPPPAAEVGVAFAYTAQASGPGPMTWSAPTAPAGFTIDAGSGVVTWTPAAIGLEPVTLDVTNAFGSDSQTFDVNVVATGTAPTITSVANTATSTGTAYFYDGDGSAEASGTQPLAWELVVAPSEMSIDEVTGAIDWTPVDSGPADVTLSVTNAFGSDTQSFVIDVSGPSASPLISSSPGLSILTTGAYNYGPSASGSRPITWELLAGPPGLALDAATGVVTWSSPLVGAHDIELRATNAVGADTQSFRLNVLGAPSITSTPAPSAQMDLGYDYDANRALEADGGLPVTWTVVDGPAGFEVDAATGEVIWTPEAPGSVTVTVRAQNDAGSDEQTFTVVVDDLPDRVPAITSVPHRFAFTGRRFLYHLRATGMEPIHYTLLAGPPEFKIDSETGLVSGVTTETTGSANLVVQATNALGSATQSFDIEFLPGTSGTTIDTVVEGWNGTTAQLLSTEGSLSQAQAADNDFCVVAPDSYVVFDFADSLPSGVGIESVKVRLEHHEDSGFGAGNFLLDVARGSLTSPVALGSSAPTIFTTDGTYTWEVGHLIDDLSDVKLIVTNLTSDRSIYLDWVRLRVTYSSVEAPAISDSILPVNPEPIPFLPPERLALGPADLEQRANVFLPPGKPPVNGWPVMVTTNVGGGTSSFPAAALSTNGSLGFFHDLVEEGIAVVYFGNSAVGSNRAFFAQPGAADGRYASFAPSADNPEKETEWAIQWAKSQRVYPLDPNRVSVRGQSQGAMNMMWATMAQDRARRSGSRHVRTSTRVEAVLAIHPPTALWAFEQDEEFVSDVIGHFERVDMPGVSARTMRQVSEDDQKNASPMRYSFDSPETIEHVSNQKFALFSIEPVSMQGGQPIEMTLDPEGFPILHDAIGVPVVHDSWFAYVFWKRLTGLSPDASAFHIANSMFAMSSNAALAAPDDVHTDTFAGGLAGDSLRQLALSWIVDALTDKDRSTSVVDDQRNDAGALLR